jgi:hypothetical protein
MWGGHNVNIGWLLKKSFDFSLLGQSVLSRMSETGNRRTRKTGRSVSDIGGRGEIRTHGGVAPTAVFKTAALNHSATLPASRSLSQALRALQWRPAFRTERLGPALPSYRFRGPGSAPLKNECVCGENMQVVGGVRRAAYRSDRSARSQIRYRPGMSEHILQYRPAAACVAHCAPEF